MILVIVYNFQAGVTSKHFKMSMLDKGWKKKMEIMSTTIARYTVLKAKKYYFTGCHCRQITAAACNNTADRNFRLFFIIFFFSSYKCEQFFNEKVLNDLSDFSFCYWNSFHSSHKTQLLFFIISSEWEFFWKLKQNVNHL